MVRVIISGEYYNALYEDGVLKHEAEPDYLDAETMLTLFPDASFYGVPWELYDELVGDHDGYPKQLADFPLLRCQKYR